MFLSFLASNEHLDEAFAELMPGILCPYSIYRNDTVGKKNLWKYRLAVHSLRSPKHSDVRFPQFASSKKGARKAEHTFGTQRMSLLTFIKS